MSMQTRPDINPWFIALTVTLATFMELLDTAVANVSLPHIAGGTATSYDETTTKFMMEQVVPTFAKLLSKSPTEPGHAGGVSCFTCHPHE